LRTLSKKQKATVAGLTLLALSGTGSLAYAYWTTNGSGAGSATAGTTAPGDAIVLTQSGTTTGMFPGGAPVNIDLTATNPAAFNQTVGEVAIAPTYPAACPAANWTLVNNVDAGSFGAAGVLTPGQTSTPVTVGTLALNETGVNQDACKLSVPTFAFTSAAGA